jgi:hypothetical protein
MLVFSESPKTLSLSLHKEKRRTGNFHLLTPYWTEESKSRASTSSELLFPSHSGLGQFKITIFISIQWASTTFKF